MAFIPWIKNDKKIGEPYQLLVVLIFGNQSKTPLRNRLQ